MRKLLFATIVLALICSCSDNTPHSEAPHSDTNSFIKILNSGPRGGGYTDRTGKKFGFRIFQTHITNDTIIPIELNINFSRDSIWFLPKSDKYIKVFLFPRSMTPDKQEEADANFGVTRVDSFLDTGLTKPTTLKITIKPKEDYVLYIGALLHPPDRRARARLFVNGQNLFYSISIDPPLDSALIPCGQVVFSTDSFSTQTDKK